MLIVVTVLVSALCTSAQTDNAALFIRQDTSTSTVLNGVDLVPTSEFAKSGGTEGEAFPLQCGTGCSLLGTAAWSRPPFSPS